jgi:hypothetical protein
LRILGTVALVFVVVIASVVFLMFSSCAMGVGGIGAGGPSHSERIMFAIYALLDAGVITLGIWGIAKLNRKTRG